MTTRVLLILLITLIGIGGFALVFATDIDLLTLAQSHFQTLQAFYQANQILSILIFFAVFTALVTFMLPGSLLLMLLAGALFGVPLGAALCVVAGTLGATNLFLLTRYFFYDTVRKRYGKRMHKINEQIDRYGAFYLLILRLAPGIPTNLIALMMGLTPISLFTFVAITFIGIAPWYIIYVTAGETFTQLTSLSDILSQDMLFVFGGTCVLLGITFWLKTRFEAKSDERISVNHL
jgi:uncharacterized membrane protein YdjX (TVP38/TMEM64 family)